MGRFGLSELPSPDRDVVGLMSHLATADSDAEFARRQIERFREAVAGTDLSCHIANSAAVPGSPICSMTAKT